MKRSLTHWECKPPAQDAQTEEIDHFDARGMCRVYGRGDHFGSVRCSFNMDIWKTSDGRLLMRCWSRREEIGWRSFEIKGVDLASIPKREENKGFPESWVPKSVRNAYNDWIEEEY